MAEHLKVTCCAQSWCLGAKVKAMLPEDLRPKLLPGCGDGLQEMGTAVPRGLLTPSMQSTLRRARWSGWHRWHSLGELRSETSLGGEDLNMNESPGSHPKSRAIKSFVLPKSGSLSLPAWARLVLRAWPLESKQEKLAFYILPWMKSISMVFHPFCHLSFKCPLLIAWELGLTKCIKMHIQFAAGVSLWNIIRGDQCGKMSFDGPRWRIKLGFSEPNPWAYERAYNIILC